MIPKIEFKTMSLEDNIDIIKWAYREKDGVSPAHGYTIKLFPELNNLGDISAEELDNKIEEVVTKYYNDNKDQLRRNASEYAEVWNEYNDKYLNTLSSYFGVEWKTDIITCTVGIIPIFPRYLDEYGFCLGRFIDNENVLRICAHEILHFKWFEKWKELYPDTRREEYDSPYRIWKYSEMVTDPVLNNKPFTDIHIFNERAYDEFYTYEKDGLLVMDYLRELYSKDVTIEEKITKGFDYIKDIVDNT